MKRLKEEEKPEDGAVAFAAALLRATRPLAPSEERMQRVRQAVLARAPSPAPRRPLPRWPAMIVAAAGISAALAATLRSRHERNAEPPMPTAMLAPGPSAALPPNAPSITPQSTQLTMTAKLQPIVRPRRGSSPPDRLLPSPSHQVAPAEGESGSDQAAIVLAAAEALRRDHDPARAERLLDDYLRRFPDGTLQEEALALDIDAASTLGEPRAASLAHDYLTRYPTGQFVAGARAALERSGPR